ncbi:MAG: translation initiation factor IF-2 [Paludibacteraceae bacterium]|nr:translation initiation factor IF-2 [Paludibacteraceae bacterium]
MPIRISKAMKDLNVGLDSIIKFLDKKGEKVESNPNVKLTDHQYELLVEEFDHDKKLKSEAEQQAQQRRKEKEERKEEVAPKEEFIPTVLDEDDKPQFKTVGKIDLDGGKKPASPKEEPEPQEEEIPAPQEEPQQEPAPQEQPDEQAVVEETQPSEQQNEDSDKEEQSENVFTLGTPVLTNGPKVVGTIDLNKINDKTRPDKKSKEERRKEREERNGARRKRTRIGQERIDLTRTTDPGANSTQRRQQGGGQFGDAGRRGKKNRHQETSTISDDDVQRQVKETLARLTEKKVKGAKYRRERREENAAEADREAKREQMESKTIKLTEFVTANELAVMMGVNVNQVIATCMNLGLMVSINQRLDAETINIVAEEFGFQTEFVSAEVVQAIQEDEDKEEDLVARPPIVTVMGHVDHGKTSLLDYIRKSHVIAGEAGGITQHIGAYNVTLESGRQITFLDTPGHEAFTAMRARGAKVTDIAIIIVAADDSVMPQTKEAIAHASAAGVPMVFAINKIDKPGANPDKIKEELAGMNYLVEEWGGKYQSEDISAKQGLHVKELLEKVLLEADLLDLKANPNRKAVGSVIESSLDKGRGYVSTVLVSNGTLHIGDIVLAGPYFGRVKAMFNERNQRITEAGPSEPALILGLNGAPQAGDNINVMDDEHEAREIAGKRLQLQREQGLRTTTHLTLDEIGRRIALGNFQEMNLVVKGDVDGSVEALKDSLIKLSTEEIKVNVILGAVGAISENDVQLAAASDAIIIGFDVRPTAGARKLADQEKVDIRTYSVIYDAIDDVKSAMEGMLSPELKEEVTGTAEVRQVFKISKVGSIAGCFVTDGKIYRTSHVRVIRDGIVVFTGELGSLKQYKDDVKDISKGQECGLNINNYNDIAEGDIIEAYEIKEIKRTLD